jgi:hypothetical protein
MWHALQSGGGDHIVEVMGLACTVTPASMAEDEKVWCAASAGEDLSSTLLAMVVIV